MENTSADAWHQTTTVTLFLVALLLSAFQTTLLTVLPRVFAYPPTAGGYFFLLQIAEFSLIPFLFNPVLFFYVFYRLGRSVSLKERYAPVGVSLFLGGLLGFSAPYFIIPETFGPGWGAAFPDLWSVLATVLGFFLLLVRSGLASLFTGFVAVAIADFRRGGTRPTETRQPVDEQFPSES